MPNLHVTKNYSFSKYLINRVLFDLWTIYRGADLSALVREASEFALKEFIKNPVPENEIVKLKHFEMAFNKIKPSVSLKVI
jgi:SpoVK/Ycf46/Vps4 family AAA+-type ATPase